LPENVTICDDNNIWVELFLNPCLLPEIIAQEQTIDFKLGDKSFCIPSQELYLKREQYYTIKNQGLTKIKEDWKDVSEREDIVVKIRIG
jgi:hypothetical protein